MSDTTTPTAAEMQELRAQALQDFYADRTAWEHEFDDPYEVDSDDTEESN